MRTFWSCRERPWVGGVAVGVLVASGEAGEVEVVVGVGGGDVGGAGFGRSDLRGDGVIVDGGVVGSAGSGKLSAVGTAGRSRAFGGVGGGDGVLGVGFGGELAQGCLDDVDAVFVDDVDEWAQVASVRVRPFRRSPALRPGWRTAVACGGWWAGRQVACGLVLGQVLDQAGQLDLQVVLVSPGLAGAVRDAADAVPMSAPEQVVRLASRRQVRCARRSAARVTASRADSPTQGNGCSSRR